MHDGGKCVRWVLLSMMGTLLMWMMATSTHDESSDCRFIYTRQPSSQLTCSLGDAGWLELVCEVHGVTATGLNFDLVWYGSFEGEDRPVVLNNPARHLITRVVHQDRQEVGCNLSMPLPLKEDLRSLFCQIQLRDGVLLQQSQSLFLHGPSPSYPCGPSSLVDTTPMCVHYPPSSQSHAMIARDEVAANAPTTTVPSSSTDGGGAGTLSVTAYAVLFIIVVFVIIIITLTILIVILYLKKCGASTRRTLTDGSSSGYNNARFGLQQDCSEPRDGGIRKEPESMQSSLPHPPKVFQCDPPSRPPKVETKAPPRPPKPVRKASDQSTPSSVHMDIYRTMDAEDLEGEPSRSIVARPRKSSPPNNHTSKKHKQKIKFRVLEGSSLGDYERSANYQRCSRVIVADSMSSVVGKSAGDDTSRLSAKEQFDPMLPHRIPCPGEVLMGHVMGTPSEEGQYNRTDKYRGDYERCKTYILPPQHSTAFSCGETGEGAVGTESQGISHRETREGAVGTESQGISHREMGEVVGTESQGISHRQTAENVVGTESQGISHREMGDSVVGTENELNKYSGNYERNAIYMEQLLHLVSGPGELTGPRETSLQAGARSP